MNILVYIGTTPLIEDLDISISLSLIDQSFSFSNELQKDNVNGKVSDVKPKDLYVSEPLHQCMHLMQL